MTRRRAHIKVGTAHGMGECMEGRSVKAVAFLSEQCDKMDRGGDIITNRAATAAIDIENMIT